MQSGKLDRIIEIGTEVPTKDSNGDTSYPWVSLFPGKTIKARIDQLSSVEAVKDKQVQVVAQYRITMRHPKRGTPQVTEQHRVKFDGKTFGIIATDNEDLKYTKLILTVKELKK